MELFTKIPIRTIALNANVDRKSLMIALISGVRRNTAPHAEQAVKPFLISLPQNPQIIAIFSFPSALWSQSSLFAQDSDGCRAPLIPGFPKLDNDVNHRAAVFKDLGIGQAGIRLQNHQGQAR